MNFVFVMDFFETIYLIDKKKFTEKLKRKNQIVGCKYFRQVISKN